MKTGKELSGDMLYVHNQPLTHYRMETPLEKK